MRHCCKGLTEWSRLNWRLYLDRNSIAYLYHTKSKSPTHHYDVLGLTRKATQPEIKSAYFKLSKLYHPDVNKDHRAIAKFQEVSEAYEILGKVTSRRKYDDSFLRPIVTNKNKNPTPYWTSSDPGNENRFQDNKTNTSNQKKGRQYVKDFDNFNATHYSKLRDKKQDWMHEDSFLNDCKPLSHDKIDSFNMTVVGGTLASGLLIYIFYLIANV